MKKIPRIFLFTLLILQINQCTSNDLVTSLVLKNPQQNRKGVPEGVFRLSDAPRELSLSLPTNESIDELSEELKLSSVSKYSRLPPLMYLRFDFENTKSNVWDLDLNAVYFTAGEKTFNVIQKKEYRERYTSVAYSRFPYDTIFAPYITLRKKTPPKDKFWFTKGKPNKPMAVGAEESGFQILPIEFIPLEIEDITLHYPGENKTERTLQLRIKTERG